VSTGSGEFDLTVLGGGTGGYVAAIRAAQLGMRVAVVERDKLGGTCLHRGCVPTKVLAHAADLQAAARRALADGFATGALNIDYAGLSRQKERVVAGLHRGVDYLMKKNAITVLPGLGRLAGPGEIEVESGSGKTTVRSARILLATGSRPKGLPGLNIDHERIVTSDDLLACETMPRSLVIIGAGAIGVEFASIMNDLGADVYLVEVLPRVLPLEDEDVSREVERAFRRRGIKVFTGARVETENVAATENGVVVPLRTGDAEHVLSAEVLLVATGRAANVEEIGLEKVGVRVERGFVVTDEHQRTSAAGIYAIGDVTGGLLLAHAAAAQGVHAVEHMAGVASMPVLPERVPRGTYCRPQVASIGLTEKQAAERGLQPRVGKFPFRANSKAQVRGEVDGMAKVVADASGRVVGIHCVGPEVTELLGEMSVIVTAGVPLDMLKAAVHAHPTLTEALHEAFLACGGEAIHI